MRLSRRHFLRTRPPRPPRSWARRARAALARIARGATQTCDGYGPLVPDPAGLLDLPRGFQYRALSTAAGASGNDARFSSGSRTAIRCRPPRRHGRRSRGPDGVTILVRNHEVDPGHSRRSSTRAASRRYDRARHRRHHHAVGGPRAHAASARSPSLSGTFRNCAGGSTPWGIVADLRGVHLHAGAARRRQRTTCGPTWSSAHGYVFEVTPTPRAGRAGADPRRWAASTTRRSPWIPRPASST